MKQQDRKHSQSLELERDPILERMRVSRERYRRVLSGEEEFSFAAEGGAQSLRTQLSRGQRSHDFAQFGPEDAHQKPLAVGSHPDHQHDPCQLRHLSVARGGFPRSAAVRWAMDHPFLCAAAVAVIVVIGSRKMVRAAMSNTARSATSTLRSLAHIDLLTRLLIMLADVAQRNMSRPPRS